MATRNRIGGLALDGAAGLGTADKQRHDREIAVALVRWFGSVRRDLPWRGKPGAARDPWVVLVSETMLQQTQVSRVAERFERFLRRFPDPAAMVDAGRDAVLAEWSGLGYYRRASNLHAASVVIVDRFGGCVPRGQDDLLSLPGVGRYTAGAVGSIAFRDTVPAVDGNIQRVLMRVEGMDLPPTSREAQSWVWSRAAELVKQAPDAGEWNEGLMELGATVCTPRGPRCPECPIRTWCRAWRSGRQEEIPAPKPRAKQPEVFHTVIVVRDGRGRLLVEQRGDGGLWAGLWQAPTIERGDRHATRAEASTAVGVRPLRLGESFTHKTTHRTVRIRVLFGDASSESSPRRGRFLDVDEAMSLGLSSPQKRALLVGDRNGRGGSSENAGKKKPRRESPGR